MKRSKIKLSNVNFYLSKEKVAPIGKVSGTFYIVNDKPVNGKYEVSKKRPGLFPFLNFEKGYIMACDIDGITKRSKF